MNEGSSLRSHVIPAEAGISADRRLAQAYRYCEWITCRHYENFPVASWLLPAGLRPSVAAIYAFARSADDFADESRYRGRSLELLDQWRDALWASCSPAYGAGTDSQDGSAAPPRRPASLSASLPRFPDRTSEEAGTVAARPARGLLTHPRPRPVSPVPGDHPIFLALADTVRRRALPVQLLDDLLTAFTMDVTKRRYADWEELLTYCRYSANPVGRLVLLLFGIRDPELHARSDEICTGLQLANHWQDLRIDLARGLLYIPQEMLRRHGVSEEELAGMAHEPGSGSFRRPKEGEISVLERDFSASPRNDGVDACFRSLMQELVSRARALFDSGERLLKGVSGGLRLELKLTVLGGRSILHRIEAGRYDVFRRRPALSSLSKLGLLARALLP